MSPSDKPLVWLHGVVSSPPFSKEARIEAGYLLRRLHPDAILILEVFAKKTSQTPRAVIEACRTRLKEYDDV